MSVVISPNYVLPTAASADVADGRNPIIGYQTIATVAHLASTTQDASFPVSNLANPSTNLKWKGTTALLEEFLTISNPDGADLDYIGVARHNWGSAQIPVSVERFTPVDAFTKLLLHCNGVDASTTFTDSSPSPKTMTANGNAQIDTAQQKFGSASALFDGTTDYISTPDSADFTLGSGDFTIDCWFRVNDAGTTRVIAGQGDSSGTLASRNFILFRESVGNFIRATVYQGGVGTTITGTTAFTNSVNAGWHHVALVRTGNILRLFLDGVQEGGDAAFTGAVTDSANQLAIGRSGEQSASVDWLGWIDEFRISVGIARWTSAFTPPLAEAEWSELITNVLLPDDGPALFRFPKLAYSFVRIKLKPGLAIPQAAVLYCGALLVIQRRIFVGHAPIKYNVQSRVVNGKSESGEFLGRIVLSEGNKTTMSLQNLRSPWARANMAPFITAAREIPFFFAWRPSDYPNEIGFVWATNEPSLLISKQTDLMQCSVEMAGVV